MKATDLNLDVKLEERITCLSKAERIAKREGKGAYCPSGGRQL